MSLVLPATGSAISFGRVRKAYTGSLPSAGANLNLRGTLATSHLGISSGAVGLSATFGSRYTPYDTTDSDNRS
jgi:hypothetical protein